jgi:hypothetical protein
LPDLLRGLSQNGKHIYHDFHDYIGHSRHRRGLDIDMEATEKIAKAIKEVHKGIITAPTAMAA